MPIYYESRLAKLELDAAERPKLDQEFEEATEGEEVEHKERLKSKWAQLEAVVGAENRLKVIAQDIVEHFERRLEAMDGKAMVVGMSRRICVDLYDAIVALRPDWHHADDDAGIIKIVMTGSASDPIEWQAHIRTKAAREELARRFKDPDDPFKVVIVRDMWLTGFDAPFAAHDVRRQTDAQPRTDAGHRARQPGLQGQARRPGRGLSRPGRRVASGAGGLHRERRHGRDGHRSGGGRRRDVGEVRSLPGYLLWLRLVGLDSNQPTGAPIAAARGPGTRAAPGGWEKPVGQSCHGAV